MVEEYEIPKLNVYFLDSVKINTDRNVSVSQKTYRPQVTQQID